MDTSKNKIEIPITVKKYEGYTVKYRRRSADKITFPFSDSDGSRLVKIGCLEIYDYDHSARFIKEGQRIKIEAPFCFNAQLGNTEIELNSDFFNALEDSPKTSNAKRILVYLCVDSIDELKGKQNLEEEYKFTFKWEENSTSPNSNELQEAKEQTIKPYVAHAEPEISFVPLENCLEIDGTNSYNVIYSPEDTDGYRFCLGNIVVRNLQKIPYKHTDGQWERVAYPKLKVFLTYNSENGVPNYAGYIYVNDSFAKKVSVEIPNGEDDISFKLYIDWGKWRDGGNPTSLLLRISTDKWEEPLYECSFKMTPQFHDDVYALDLGTTGIVVAKEKEGKQEIIILEDVKTNQIEQEPEIISSLTMLTVENGDGNSKMVLSPSANEYYGTINNKKRFRLVPAKFIIGQERIPYLKEFYLSDEINKKVDLFDLDNSEIDLVDTNTEDENLKTISTIVGALYKSIFKRFSKETNQIKKLVITYPNTYTIENLDSIKSVLQDELNLNLNGQVSFVPESDAVAAYYFNQKIMKDGGFFDENGNIKEISNVVIYDMGAGTLDLSLIEFKQSADNSITASIVNKIGIPLAGNYLDYIIYNTLQCKNKTKNLEGKDNTIKDIIKGIKCSYKESEESIIKSQPIWYVENQSYLELEDNDTYQTLFNDSLEDFLECCSKTVLELLIPNNTKVDTIVFSGRASKFSVLRNKVKESLRNNNSEVKEDDLLPVANSGDHLKTCVAIGALKYQSFFNNNDLFKIENKNLYSKIAVVYWGRKEGKWCVCVEFLIDPHSEKERSKEGEFINGTWCKEYSNNIEIKNFFPNKHLYYIQTYLDQKRIEELFTKVYQDDCINEDDLNWAFVNVLFKYRITENKPFIVSLRISKDNKIIDRRIGNKWLLNTKLMENIEDNILYRRSMWPFITKLKD